MVNVTLWHWCGVSDAIDDDAVYGLAFSDLIVLKAEASELLAKRGEVSIDSP